MTYGENSRELREAMIWLLDRQRILHRLGGPGPFGKPPWSTETEREQMGQVIQRYRLSVLTWCRQAVSAATPKTDLSATTAPQRTPIQELRFRLDEAITATGAWEPVETGEPLVDLLATGHGNALLDAWQRRARAAALGEHDFTADVNLGYLDPAQSRTVIKDAADLTRALVLLDDRYENVPGWTHIPGYIRVQNAAEATSRMLADQECGTEVDSHGWQPPPGLIEGPLLPGVAGAVQAQHNMVLHLAHSPNALNLRRILHSQAQVSHQAARIVATAAPELMQTFSHRALLYHDLLRASRDVGGLVGGGGHAVAESQIAASRLQRPLPRDTQTRESLHELARLCTRTDAKLAATIEHGFTEQYYLVGEASPSIDDQATNMVHPARQRYAPPNPSLEAPLLDLAREQLHPPTPPTKPPPAPDQTRALYDAVLTREVARVNTGHRR